MRRSLLGVVAGAAMLVAVGAPIGAQLSEHATDLPDGTPSDPAAPTPADTTAVGSMLEHHDVDAVLVCVTDPASLHLTVGGLDQDGVRRNLDTVMWLFDGDGTMVAVNDDRSTDDLGSQIGPGIDTEPGVHTVAIGYFRTRPYTIGDVLIEAPGQGPLDHWAPGFGVSDGHYRADLVAGATGSDGCAGAPGVLTGDGRCQALGGNEVAKGKAQGIERAGERRASRSC